MAVRRCRVGVYRLRRTGSGRDSTCTGRVQLHGAHSFVRDSPARVALVCLGSDTCETDLRVDGRVEDWRADCRVRWWLQPLSRWSAVRLPWSRFQSPPPQTQHADFPHYAFLPASRQGLCGRSGRERFPSGMRPSDSTVASVQSQPLVQPLRTPPLPTKSTALASPHHVPPYLLLYPVANVAETPARMSDREVVHPSPQDRIDDRHHPSHRS